MPPKKQKRAPRRRAPGGGTIAALLATLDVPADALAAANTLEEEFNVIKRAFHVAAKTHHPDKGGDEAAFRDVRAAFDVLKQKFTDASGGSFSYKTARGSKASTAKEWKDASATADDTHRPSYDFYAAAAEADMPLYRAELAKSNRSKCNADDGKNRHNCKFEDPFKIPKGHVRIGVLDAQSGGRVLYTGPHTTPFACYSRWVHLECWRVPARIHQGLPHDPASPSAAFERALLAMDELLFTGLAEMTPEDRAPLVAHVMDQSNWATVRGKKLGAEPGAGPTAKKGGKKGAKGAKAGDSKVEDDEPEPEEPAAGRKRKAANSTSTAEGAGAIVVFPGKPVGKAPPAAAARATKRSKPIPVPKPTAVPKAEPKAAEPKAIDLTGASTDEDDAAAANPQPPKRPRGRPKKQPRAPAPTSPAGGYASGNAVVAVPAKGPKKSAAAAAIVRRADGGVAPHLQLAGKTIVLTGVFPELGGGCGLNLGKDKARRLCEQFGGRVTTAVSGRTDLLLVGSEPGASKVAKARSTPGCMLMNIDQLREQLTAGNALPDKGTAAAAALTSGVVINAFSGGYVGKNGGNGLAYDMSDAQLRYLATGGGGGGGPGLLR